MICRWGTHGTGCLLAEVVGARCIIMSSIHQINASYSAVQDRILLRIASREDEEFRLWITRRVARQLIEMMSAIGRGGPAAGPGAAATAPDRSGCTTASAPGRTEPGRFSQRYEERVRSLPMGEEPVLVQSGTIEPADGLLKVGLVMVDQRTLTMALGQEEARALVSLLLQTAARGDWGGLSERPAEPGPVMRQAYH